MYYFFIERKPEKFGVREREWLFTMWNSTSLCTRSLNTNAVLYLLTFSENGHASEMSGYYYLRSYELWAIHLLRYWSHRTMRWVACRRQMGWNFPRNWFYALYLVRFNSSNATSQTVGIIDNGIVHGTGILRSGAQNKGAFV